MTTYTPVVGDAFDLFDWAGAIGGASGGDLVPLLNLPDLTANNEAWDTSTFTTDGNQSASRPHQNRRAGHAAGVGQYDQARAAAAHR